MPFPAPSFSFPTKDDMADYLEAYAERFALPVRTGVRVDRLSRDGSHYTVSAGDRRFIADHVVVAMATYQVPRRPPLADQLDPSIVQLHSNDYRNPSQLQPGDVLLVGAGNSGADIAMEVARTHRTWLAGRSTGQVPFRIGSPIARLLLPFIFRVIFHRILTVKTPIGRRVRPSLITKGAPLIRVKAADLAAAGVQRTPRVEGVRDGRPVLADGRVLDVANVIWCTGFQGGFSWIDLPVVDAHDEPIHESGIVPNEPGLYFVGLHFLHSAVVDDDSRHRARRSTHRRYDCRSSAGLVAHADCSRCGRQPRVRESMRDFDGALLSPLELHERRVQAFGSQAVQQKPVSSL